MPGKLNGVIAATTPTGWRIISSSMPDAMSSRLLPMHQRRDAGGDFDVLDAAPQLAFGLGERLAALLRDRAARSRRSGRRAAPSAGTAAGCDRRAACGATPAAPAVRRARPWRRRRPTRAARRRDVSPVAGLSTGDRARCGRGFPVAADEVLKRVLARSWTAPRLMAMAGLQNRAELQRLRSPRFPWHCVNDPILLRYHDRAADDLAAASAW